MSLNEYRRKRQFDRTREPEPGRPLPKGQRAIFVVQLHHASRRHYDFRLQVGDALKSWAVPKGPSFDPSVKRMAVEVEDHPVDYAAFEGDIPKGQYGGGHVATFDHGVWATDGDAEAQLAKGHLRFELFGGKLKGGWHLVRSGKPARQPQWLLFKDKDAFAGELEADDLLDDVTAAPEEDARRAGGSRKLAAGAGKRLAAETGGGARAAGSSRAASATKATTRNKVEKGTKGTKATVPTSHARAARPAASTATPAAASRPRRIDWARRALHLDGARKATLKDAPFVPQLAKLGPSVPHGGQWLHELKWDGYRIVATIVDGKVRLWSRNALEWTEKLPDIAGALAQLGLKSAALDGELIAGGGAQADFNLLQATLSGEKQGVLNYVLFDLLHIQGVAIDRAPLLQRKELLAALLERPVGHLALSSHIVGEGERAFAVASERAFEGIISKRADQPYHGGRGDDWRKTKQLDSDEFAVVGYVPGKGGRTGVGSLLLARPDSLHGWLYAGRVGTGFNDEQLRQLSREIGKDGSRKPTVHIAGELQPAMNQALWFEPRFVVEVFIRGTGSQGVLRQASLKAIRMDKDVGDLLDSDRGPVPAGTRKAAKAGKKSTPARAAKSAHAAAAATSDVATGQAAVQRISSPTKLLYPDDKLTKQDVADYYLAVMDHLLPEIEGRPLSVIRCPGGVGKHCFFQKHYTAGLDQVALVKLKEEAGNNADYLVVDSPAALMELVQFNSIEFHPWGSHAATPGVADRVVFDLDPGPGVAFAQVKKAAVQVRALLGQLGLQSFLRTTGGKGLHVVVPLNPGCEWDLVKRFAHGFADALAQSEPERYLAVSTLKLRPGKIFVDYLRNGRGATAVASYSLRARPGAPVSMPLAWSALGRLERPDQFNLRNVPGLLRRRRVDPWAAMAAVRQNLGRWADDTRARPASRR